VGFWFWNGTTKELHCGRLQSDVVHRTVVSDGRTGTDPCRHPERRQGGFEVPDQAKGVERGLCRRRPVPRESAGEQRVIRRTKFSGDPADAFGHRCFGRRAPRSRVEDRLV